MKLFSAALAVCALLWAVPAAAAVLTASTPAALTADLRASHAGDVIFAKGLYPGFAIKFPVRGATIKSADPLNRAAFPDLVIQGYGTVVPGHLTFDGIDTVRARVDHAADVHFTNVHVYTPGLADPLKATATGILFTYSDNVSVRSSDFSLVYRGVVINASTNFEVSSSVFHDVRSDGIDIGSPSSAGLIDRDTFRDFKPVYTGNPRVDDHSDAVQFTRQGAKIAAHDIVVSNNLVDFTNSPYSEGMLAGDNGPAYDRLTFRGNVILGSSNPKGPGGGLQVFNATNTTLDSNTVVASKGGRYAIVGDKSLIYTNNQAQSWGNGASGTTIPAFTDGGAAMRKAGAFQ